MYPPMILPSRFARAFSNTSPTPTNRRRLYSTLRATSRGTLCNRAAARSHPYPAVFYARTAKLEPPPSARGGPVAPRAGRAAAAVERLSLGSLTLLQRLVQVQGRGGAPRLPALPDSLPLHAARTTV